MKKIKFNIAAILLSILTITAFTSCDEGGEPDPGGTAMEKFAGDWYITLTDTDGNVLAEHTLHSTYNTSANDSLWVDDHTNGYWLKSKVGIDMTSGVFQSMPNTPNLNDGGTFTTITEGKIIKDGGVSRGGHVVDSIYFRVHFSYDDPGYDIIHTGHKRTGFLEDEY